MTQVGLPEQLGFWEHSFLLSGALLWVAVVVVVFVCVCVCVCTCGH
jgi:hypothetical protein